MTIRFIHTSDWQIGKVFHYVDADVAALLRAARIECIDTLGNVAVARNINHVVVAGDVYDAENLTALSLNQPLERMRRFSSVHWYLLPGNHDPHRPHGLWDRIVRNGAPNNVHILLEQKPCRIDSDRFALLPAPLFHKQSLSDPTSYMNDCETPDGYARVGIAHGSITEFGSGTTPNLISSNRPHDARLAYLALGDWHGQKMINQRCWYSGTPETDAFSVDYGGKALVVEIDSADDNPRVEEISTGKFSWMTLDRSVNSKEDVDQLESHCRNLGSDPKRILLRMKIEGTVSLDTSNYFSECIENNLAAAFMHLDVRKQQLLPQPSEEDLNEIDIGGFVRKAAEQLKLQAQEGSETERRVAADALQLLYREWRGLQEE